MTVKLKTPSNGSVSLTPQDTAADVVLTVPSGTGSQLAVADSSGYTYSGGLVVSPQTGFKNRIINGAMMIAQRGTAAVTTDGSYAVDRFIFSKSGSQTFTGQSSTTVPSGFTNSISVTIGTGSTPGASDRLTLTQGIEGLNVADLGWGAAGAQSVTLSFWVRSSLTGAFGVAFRNSATNRAYVASYTVSAANTWEYKTLTIPGDTSGTWAKDNTAGIFLNFDLGCGSTFSTTSGSWQAGNFLGLTGGVKLNATSGATFYITGVQLEKGSVATPFEFRSIGQELALCQRYGIALNGSFGNGVVDEGSKIIRFVNFATPSTPRTSSPSVTSISGGLYDGVTSLSITTGVPSLVRACANALVLDIAYTGSSASGRAGAISLGSGFASWEL